MLVFHHYRQFSNISFEGSMPIKFKQCDSIFYSRFWAAVVGEANEHIYGGGEQYTYLDLKSRNYPMWVREQGVGRNKSDIVTNVMDALYHAGGDYYTTYWPQVTTLSLFLFSKISNCLSGLIFVLKKILSGVLFLWLP